MALNFISRHGIIIGAVALLAGLIVIVSEIPRIYYLLNIDDSDNFYSSNYLILKIATLSVALLFVIFSILLIVGIVKKRHMLLAPWLVGGILGAVISSCATLYDTFARTRFYMSDLFTVFVIIGLQVIILHPIYNLYLEMRREYATGDHKELGSNYTQNIQNACEKVPKNTIV